MSGHDTSTKRVEVNGRDYAWPNRPLVVVCIDGCEPNYAASDGGGYIERAVAEGAMPFMQRMLAGGTRRLADCVIPRVHQPQQYLHRQRRLRNFDIIDVALNHLQ